MSTWLAWEAPFRRSSTAFRNAPADEYVREIAITLPAAMHLRSLRVLFRSLALLEVARA
jgi:hypothetical protein